MKISQIGEFGLIRQIERKIPKAKYVVRGIGDDAAVIPYNKRKYLLLTTDMLVEGVHFKRTEASFFQIGRKSLAASVSDIAAMGGIPKYAVVSMGLPGTLSVKATEEIVRGMCAVAQEFAIEIVGGDTVAAPRIVISISLVGKVKKSNVIYRSGARVGDLIFVTGTLGNTRKLKQFNFIPRVKEAQQIIKRFKPSALIDISDGLVSDLHRIAQQSKVGAVIFEQLIPRAQGATVRSALYDGEDFELLFTMSLKSARKFYKQAKFAISCIGKIVEKRRGITLIDKKAKVSVLKEKGFRHFEQNHFKF